MEEPDATTAIAFALAWIVPSWLVFELVPTKLPHYVMPLYPAIAIVTVLALSRGFVAPRDLAAKLTALLMPFIPAGIAVGLAFAAKTLDGRLPWAGLAVMLLATLVAFAAWWRFVRDEPGAAALLAVAASPILMVGVFSFTQPVMQSLRLSPRLAETARALDCPNPAVGTLGYREPSLVFLAGTELRMFAGAERRGRVPQRRRLSPRLRRGSLRRPLPAGDRPGRDPPGASRAALRLQFQRRAPARDWRICGAPVIEGRRPPTRRR